MGYGIMAKVEIDPEVVAGAVDMLNKPLLNQDMGYWVSTFASIALYTEILLARADEAKTELEVAVAQSKLDKNGKGEKVSAVVLDAWATVMTIEQAKAANKMRADARKMAALRDAVEQAINALKFLGKYDGQVTLGGR